MHRKYRIDGPTSDGAPQVWDIVSGSYDTKDYVTVCRCWNATIAQELLIFFGERDAHNQATQDQAEG